MLKKNNVSTVQRTFLSSSPRTVETSFFFSRYMYMYASVRQTDAVLNNFYYCELWPMCGVQDLYSMRVIFITKSISKNLLIIIFI